MRGEAFWVFKKPENSGTSRGSALDPCRGITPGPHQGSLSGPLDPTPLKTLPSTWIQTIFIQHPAVTNSAHIHDPSPQILPHKGKELGFLPLKCITFLPCKSFPQWVKLSCPEIQSYGEGVKLSLPPRCTASPQILLHMGKESSFLPLAMHSYPSLQILPHMGKSQAFFCQNAKLSFPTNPSHYM